MEITYQEMNISFVCVCVCVREPVSLIEAAYGAQRRGIYGSRDVFLLQIQLDPQGTVGALSGESFF